MEEKNIPNIAAETADKMVKDAASVARTVIEQAAQTAVNLKRIQERPQNDQRIARLLSTAIKEAFGEYESSGRFMDMKRIPLICKSIIDMHENIKEIKAVLVALDDKFVDRKEFTPIQKILYGLIGVLGITVIGSLLKLILK